MIHLYRFRDLNVLLDVGSGAVHTVSDIASDILSFFDASDFEKNDIVQQAVAMLQEKPCLENYPDDTKRTVPSVSEIEETVSEIRELISEGMLFTDDSIPFAAGTERRGAVIKAMCLHVAHDCNMRCAYCFADTGEFQGERSLLPLETGKKAIDFLIAHSGGRRNLEIDFFGGEPLMNWDVVKELVAYGRIREQEADKHIRFTITTNGLLLDEGKDAFINEHMDNVILSIDGRPEVNDRMRKTVSGDGTYTHIIKNLRRIADARTRQGKLYYVRGTYTGHNKDFSDDVAHLVDAGFENVSVEPVVTDAANIYALTEDDLPQLYAEYERLADIYLEHAEQDEPFSFFHFNVDLTQGPCVYKRTAGCGAGTEYVAVSPEGDIYPCHQFVGETEYRLGNVADDKFENKLYDNFIKAHIGSKDDCKSCWAKYYCSGGCHANALHANGDIMKPHTLGCALEKKRLECAIGIRATLD